MSAIFGIFHAQGNPVAPADLSGMASRMRHCGPDGAGQYCNKNIGLGQLVLETGLGRQGTVLPFETPKLVLSCDMRLDNRSELLEKLSPIAPDISDPSLVALAYEKWGRDFPKFLEGDFTLALWDKRRNRLLLARDQMGIRNLYYHIRGGSLYFATEIKALLALDAVPRKLNQRKVVDHFLLIYDDCKSTFYQDILRFPAAHSLTANDSGRHWHRYFKFDISKRLTLSGDREYIEGFREHLIRAVHDRTSLSHPVACELSGGLDSTSVTAVAAQKLASVNRQPITITQVPPSHDKELKDERPLIRRFLKFTGIDKNMAYGGTGIPLESMLEWAQEAFDEPLHCTFSFFSRRALSNLKDRQVRVLLNGFGGDDVVSSQRYRPLTGVIREKGLGYYLGQHWKRYPSLLTWVSSLAFDMVKMTPRLEMLMFPSHNTIYHRRLKQNNILSPALMKRWRVGERLKAQRLRGANPNIHAAQAARAFGNDSVEGRVTNRRQAAARFGIEVGFPLLDRRLVAFYLACPLHLKFRDGINRYLFRQAVQGLIPETVRTHQGKAGFLLPSISDEVYKNMSYIKERARQMKNPYVDSKKIQDILAPVHSYRDVRAMGVQRHLSLQALMFENFYQNMDH